MLAALLVLPCGYDSHNPDASPSVSNATSSDASDRRADMHAKWLAAQTDDAGHRPVGHIDVPLTQPTTGKYGAPLVPPNRSSDGGTAPPARLPEPSAPPGLSRRRLTLATAGMTEPSCRPRTTWLTMAGMQDRSCRRTTLASPSCPPCRRRFGLTATLRRLRSSCSSSPWVASAWRR